MVFVLSIICGE